MSDALDTDRIEVSGFDETDPGRCILALEDTAEIVLEQVFDETLDLDEVDTDRAAEPAASPARPRRHKAVYSVVSPPQTSSDS